MKGYKALLDQSWLHGHPQMIALQQQKQQFDNLLLHLKSFSSDIQQNAHQVQEGLKIVEKQTQKSAEMIHNKLNNLVQKLNQDGQITYQIRCFCGFGTDCNQQFIIHSKQFHKRKSKQAQSSHFLTLFSNLLKKDEKIFRIFEPDANEQFQQKQKLINMQQVKRQIKMKMLEKQNEKIKQRQEARYANKTKTLPRKQNKVNAGDQHQKKQIFYCGQCSIECSSFQLYSVHLKKHDYMIPPNSSHIIIRGQARSGIPMRVANENQNEENQKYVCSCNPNQTFSRSEYVSHILKWHKGISPKK